MLSYMWLGQSADKLNEGKTFSDIHCKVKTHMISYFAIGEYNRGFKCEMEGRQGYFGVCWITY